MRTLGWLMSFALWGTVTQTINFDSAKPGSAPPGWTSRDAESPVGDSERLQRSQPALCVREISKDAGGDAPDARCPLAILNERDVKDGDLSVRVKPVAGKEDRAGGLVFRYRDPDNYYVVRANALENSIMLYKVEDGKRTRWLARRGRKATA
jgi:hypothetical protein